MKCPIRYVSRSSTPFGVDRERYQDPTSSAHDEPKEYILGRIIDATNYERTITCKGTLIMVYDPKARDNPQNWEHEDTTHVVTRPVPAGFEIKVVNGWVTLTK